MRGLLSDKLPQGEAPARVAPSLFRTRSSAVEHDADLIVIGAYSRPRSAEIIFGGVTRTMLKRLPIPVLMSR